MTNSRLISLAGAFVGGARLDAAGIRELVGAVAADAVFAAELRSQVLMDTLLRVRMGRVPAWAEWGTVVEGIEGRRSGRVVEFPERRHEWARRAIPLAVAASVMLAVGLFVGLFMRPGRDEGLGFQVAKRVGKVTVTGSVVATDAGSFCRVKLSDGSMLCLDQSTTVDFSPGRAGAAGSVEHQKGRLYCEIFPQKEPWVVISGDVAIEVLGTKLEIGGNEPPYVSVFDGRVRVAHDRSAFYASAGQTIRSVRAGAGQKVLRLERMAETKDMLTWAQSLGMDTPAALANARAARLPAGDPQVDFGNALAIRGTWSIEQAGKDVVIKQESLMVMDSHLHLGAAKWKRGVLTYKFRVTQIGVADFGVGAEFFEAGHSYHSFTSEKGLKRWRSEGYRDWIRVKYDFEVTSDDRVLLKVWELWPEGAPHAKIAAQNWVINSPVKIRNICGIGFSTRGCAAEFAEIKLEGVITGTGPAPRNDPDVPINWTFEQGIPPDMVRLAGNAKTEWSGWRSHGRLRILEDSVFLSKTLEAPDKPFEAVIVGSVLQSGAPVIMAAVRSDGMKIPAYRYWQSNCSGSLPKGGGYLRARGGIPASGVWARITRC